MATLATGNVMLGFAAILLGVVVGLQRRATGGILAPILTHLVWSVSMLYALPAIFLAGYLSPAALLERAAHGLLVAQRLARDHLADRLVGDHAPRCPSSRSGCARW